VKNLFNKLLFTLLVIVNKSLFSMNRLNKIVKHLDIHNSTVQNHQPSSIWQEILRSGKDDINLDQKIACYIQDCKKLTHENSAIPFHQMNQNTVRFATYNVHFWHGAGHGKSKQGNFENIIKVIKKINADVIVLQEVVLSDKFDTIKLFEKMGYKYWAFCKTVNHGSFGNMLLSKYPIIKSVITKLFDADKKIKKQQRGFVNMRIQLPNNKAVSVYGTHLDVYDESENTRLAEIQELIEFTKQDKNQNIIVTADFNAVRKQDYQYKINDKLVWDLVNKSNKSRFGINTPTKALDELASESFVDSFTKSTIPGPKFTVWSGTVVDFIFLNKNWNLPISGCYVMYTSESDHIPVIMDVKVS